MLYKNNAVSCVESDFLSDHYIKFSSKNQLCIHEAKNGKNCSDCRKVVVIPGSPAGLDLFMGTFQ